MFLRKGVRIEKRSRDVSECFLHLVWCWGGLSGVWNLRALRQNLPDYETRVDFSTLSARARLSATAELHEREERRGGHIMKNTPFISAHHSKTRLVKVHSTEYTPHISAHH